MDCYAIYVSGDYPKGGNMPRKARLDVPGCLYHVISRGNERRKIFLEESDYEDFTARFRELLNAAGAKCLGWCLMPNHFHLVILRGERTLSELMRRLLTGYAVHFNLKYDRAGHLFQNRYKTIICEADAYLKELLAYVHLNPLRAKLVTDVPGLAAYRWCGHGALTGARLADFLDREYALSYFGEKGRDAVSNYLKYLEEAYLRQKSGQYPAAAACKFSGGSSKPEKSGAKDGFDSRVLGSSDFVEKLIASKDGSEMGGLTKTGLVARIEGEFGISYAEMISSSRARRISSARAAYCFLAKEECGIKGEDLARELKVSSSGLCLLAARGRRALGFK